VSFHNDGRFSVIQLVEFMTPVFALGFMAGYGMRSLVSHHRRMRSTR